MAHGSAVAPLIEMLRDERWSVRSTAAESLGWIGDTTCLPVLIETLKDEDWNVRLCTTWALGEMGDERALAPLIEMFNDKHWRVRYKARRSLRKITGEDFGESYTKWKDWYGKRKP